MKALGHIIAIVLWTLVSQVGGIVWLINYGYFRWPKRGVSRTRQFCVFLLLYLLATFLIVPPLARLGGRVPLPITKSKNLRPHNYITPLLNRHYVKPQLRQQLIGIAQEINANNPAHKVSYLDANFPFVDGFPLLPHLSHNDGRKVDLSFYYTKDKKKGNLKPARSGYGQFVEPKPTEFNQTADCLSRGYGPYAYTKHLTLGSRDDLEFDAASTKQLVNLIIQEPLTQKLLIEPHLKHRLQLTHPKVRFQGCHAVRHDDHIHYQIVR